MTITKRDCEMTVELIYYDWSPDSMLEVTLPEPDNFLKVQIGRAHV